VFVDPENFLNDDHAALGRAGWVGPVGAELMAVVGRQCEVLTQINLLLRSYWAVGSAGNQPISPGRASVCHASGTAALPHRRSIDECQMNEKSPKINRLNLRPGGPDYWHGWFITSQKVSN
jgi:hypothetical protein